MDWSFLDFSWRVIIAVIIGGFANFFLGALWYALLFQKPWVKATGRTIEEIQQDGGPGMSMALTLLGGIVTTLIIALLYQWSGGSTVLDGLIVGLTLGLGLSVWERLKTAVYNVDDRVQPWALFTVDASYNVCGLALAGLVYAMIA
ncbi:MAG: DUF1761 domain-containing protein [Saccharospirillum sp.]